MFPWRYAYDTIQYDIFMCARKLTKWPDQPSARHRNNRFRKKQKQKPIRSEETVRARTKHNHVMYVRDSSIFSSSENGSTAARRVLLVHFSNISWSSNHSLSVTPSICFIRRLSACLSPLDCGVWKWNIALSSSLSMVRKNGLTSCKWIRWGPHRNDVGLVWTRSCLGATSPLR